MNYFVFLCISIANKEMAKARSTRSVVDGDQERLRIIYIYTKYNIFNIHSQDIYKLIHPNESTLKLSKKRRANQKVKCREGLKRRMSKSNTTCCGKGWHDDKGGREEEEEEVENKEAGQLPYCACFCCLAPLSTYFKPP